MAVGIEIMQPRTFVISTRSGNDRFLKAANHLDSRGISYERFIGVDWRVSGLETRFTYDYDHPGTGFKISSKLVCLSFSHYILWRALEFCEGDYFWILEDDSEWDIDWKPRYEQAFSSLPDDWDLLWIGSCCTMNRPSKKIANNVWEIKYPMCTHAYMVRKKAIPKLVQSLDKIYAPLDVALFLHAMPDLNVYTILPRLCGQFNTTITP